MTIISYGTKDLYLTGAPQITFFKIVYRRYTNFSMESIKIDSTDPLTFDESVDIQIPKYGDLVHKIYLEINIPQFQLNLSDLGLTNSDDITIAQNKYNIAKENYQNVINFMQLNVLAYQTAVTKYNAINGSANTLYTNVNAIYNGKSSIIDTYNTTLATIYPINTQIYRQTSNLQDIILFSKFDVTFPDNTKNQIYKDSLMGLYETVMKNSINIQNIFFNLYKEASETLNNANSGNLKFAWVNRLGHSIIERIDVTIGGQIIDRHYGEWLDVLYELSGNRYLDDLYNKMIGNVSSMTLFDYEPSPVYKLVIPLQFWFNRRNGLAFPLIAMQYNELTISIKIRKLESCMYIQKIEGLDMVSLIDIWNDKGLSLSYNLLVDYIFLDSKERQKFAQCAHEYLIEANQTLITNTDILSLPLILDLNHPCKELIWIARKQAYVQNNDGYTKIDWSNYSIGVSNGPKINWIKGFEGIYANPIDMTNQLNLYGNPLLNAQLSFNGYNIVNSTTGSSEFYNYLEPNKHHRNTPKDGINVYSFSINPEVHQPSGACNMSRIINPVLFLKFKDGALSYNLSDIYPDIVPGGNNDSVQPTGLDIFIFAPHYNILRLMGGYGGLGFTF